MTVNTCKDCPCAGYPTDESQYGIDMGCLPCQKEITDAYDNHNQLWACHSNPNKVCRGLVNKRGVDKNAKPTHGELFGDSNFNSN